MVSNKCLNGAEEIIGKTATYTNLLDHIINNWNARVRNQIGFFFKEQVKGVKKITFCYIQYRAEALKEN